MLHMTDCKKTAKAKTENTQKLYEDQFQITELQFDPSLSVTSQVQEKKNLFSFTINDMIKMHTKGCIEW